MTRIIKLAAIIAFSICTVNAQTLSNCRTSFQLPPNVKPGVSGGFTFTRDGKTLLVPSVDGRVRLVDLASGEIKRVLTVHTNYVYKAIFSPDLKQLATSSRDNTARIFDFTSAKELRKFEGFRCAVKEISFSPDGRMFAASGNDGMLKLWDLKTGKELKSLVHRDSADIDMGTYSFVFSRDGKLIYAANGDGTISVWNVRAGQEVRNWKAHGDATLRIMLSEDQRRLISYGDVTVKVWSTRDCRELQSFTITKTAGAQAHSSTFTLSPDEQLIAASYVEVDPKQNTYVAINTVVWNAKTGEQLFKLAGHKLDIGALIFTPDSRLLLTGSVDTTIRFWDMSTGQEIRTLKLQ